MARICGMKGKMVDEGGGWSATVGGKHKPHAAEPSPMRSIPIIVRIANAAACLAGAYGAVVERARLCDCSRQTIYNQGREVLDAVAAFDRRDRRDAPRERREELDRLRRENQTLWDWVDRAVEFDRDQQWRFAATAAAMGLSVSQVRDLLALILGDSAAPSRSAIGRWTAAAAAAAGRVLVRLDARCREVIVVACLDEIFFHRRPVLVGVEPASMTWFLGRKADALRGETWAEALGDFPRLEHVVSDAGGALRAGVERVRRERMARGEPAPTSTLDVFHTKRRANQALRPAWKRVERDFDAYEAARGKLERARRRGAPAHSEGARAAVAWRAVERSFAQYEEMESAWRAIAEALEVFRPDGRLNDRAWAETRVSEHPPALRGRAWEPVVNHLRDPASFGFLDRMRARLEALPIAPELLGALLELRRLQRLRRRDDGARVEFLKQTVVCAGLDADWPKWHRAVAGIIRATVRASSAVEGMNSVLRMHQSRHRTMTQGLLDLKRLHWNTKRFQSGKRRGASPYERLGLTLPSHDFWELLKEDLDAVSTAAKHEAARKARSRLIAKVAAA